ncbi:VOC family protein [Chitinophaga solisilvae]|uniref:VOC family protein n=1 Tax=Chitinophaga solisilvae TaxID=1233460 RepID=A0A433WB95_9BACT|nr:VOC family protein [Chitinophaga solisilvae]NSL86387.1 VOC family protein [Chitinophaga solisilvae]
MAKMIFVNVAVKDLQRSIAFFNALGYNFNPQFTDDKAGCLVISDTIYAMLLVEPFFQSFLPEQIQLCDTGKSTEALICLSADSRAEVDDIVEKAIKAGATTPKETQDMGFMYSRSFRDLDGHHWEYMWMDESAMQ